MTEEPEKYDIKELAEKFLRGKISGEERTYFENWYADFNDEHLNLNNSKYKDAEEMRHSILTMVEAEIEKEEVPFAARKSSLKWYRFAAAASIALFLGIGLLFFIHRQPVLLSKSGSTDHVGGKNTAILTLADGKKIILNNAKEGELAREGNMVIRKTSEGQVVCEMAGGDSRGKSSSEENYHTICTPRGGQYQIVLEDGTRVWLNSASTMKFPSHFKGDERKVELTGEAYFEVADNASMPFLVTSGNQLLRVLGTHFNVNAYQDEGTINTTLIEGKVKVSQISGGKSRLIEPGQQARLGSGIELLNVNAGDVISWKNGYFVFSGEKVQNVMKQISRWYDVDVTYEGTVTSETFVGSIPRDKQLTEVLRILELTKEAKFRIEGKEVVVSSF